MTRFIAKVGKDTRRFTAGKYGSVPAARAAACAFKKAAADMVLKFEVYRGQVGHSNKGTRDPRSIPTVGSSIQKQNMCNIYSNCAKTPNLGYIYIYIYVSGICRIGRSG